MSSWFVVSLTLVVAVVLGARLLVPALPLRTVAGRISVTDAVLGGLGVLGLAFTAVGVTMYDGGSLDVHLAAIFASVVVLAVIVAALVLPPSRRSPVVP